MRILLDASIDIDQGGFGAAEGASQQLTVLREAAGVGMVRNRFEGPQWWGRMGDCL